MSSTIDRNDHKTATEIMHRVATTERRMMRVVDIPSRHINHRLTREFYYDLRAMIIKDDIAQMVKDAMREVDQILGIPEAF